MRSKYAWFLLPPILALIVFLGPLQNLSNSTSPANNTKTSTSPSVKRNGIAPFITRGTGTERPMRHQAMTWEDIDRLRDFWPGKLIVKGILREEDAVAAVDHGADAIVVSNHGGRAMDSAAATIDVLPEVVAAVGHRTTVILDSGIRRGSDMVKALALAADAVMTGRATLYGISTAGQAGAEKALSILMTEFEKTMAYVGCRNVAEVTKDIFEKSCVA